MLVRLRDLMIVLLNFSVLAKASFCSGKLYGFECCKKTVHNPEYDKNGYAYGTENGKSCIVPKGCHDCVKKEDSSSESSSNDSASKDHSESSSSDDHSSDFCSGKLYGFQCCTKTVYNPEYDKNGYAYGTENGKSCIVPKGCSNCVRKNDGWENDDWSDQFCSGNLKGYPCCKKIVYDPDYDSNHFAYGHEKGKTCIVPKGCKSCVRKKKYWWSNDFCSGTLKGYRCCTRVVTNPDYDSSGFAYGTENGKKCIVPKGCKWCVEDEKWGPRYTDSGFCIGSMFGFKCCKAIISNPQYDTDGYAYGEEKNETCIIPKDCKICVSDAPVTSTVMTTTLDDEWSAITITPTATAGAKK